jgi:glycosyltransferase involved in cell wall biosynthesis
MTGAAAPPRVSVVMPSYNHERYVASAIASVLGQTICDLELVVIDDGSDDRSADIIAGIEDRRLRYKLLRNNGGACAAMNIALQMARGPFIAVCNSDDEWQPDKLRQQLEVLQSQTKAAAVFSDVDWIDQDGAALEGSRAPPFEAAFRQQNRARWTWIRDLLETGNKLCHPSVLIRREVYDTAGPYDNRLRQLPDLDMWVRVLSHYDIFVSDSKLVRFRIHDSNTSIVRTDISRRSINEHNLILRTTIGNMSRDHFMKAFGFRASSIDDDIDLQIEKALYLLDYRGNYLLMFRELGLEMLYAITNEDTGIDRLARKYGFDIFAFQREMALDSPWIVEARAVVEEPVQQQLARFRSIDLAKSIAARYRAKIHRKVRQVVAQFSSKRPL